MKLWTTGEVAALVLKAEDEAERDERQRVFDELIASASANDGPGSWTEVTDCEVDDFGHTGKRRQCTLEQWIINQQKAKAMTDGND